MITFIMWLITGIAFIILGIYVFCSKRAKAFGFWANAKVMPIKDVKAYNRALGKLWIGFGTVFALLGLPLLAGQNSPFIILSIIGALFEVIITMIVYTIRIEGRYRE